MGIRERGKIVKKCKCCGVEMIKKDSESYYGIVTDSEKVSYEAAARNISQAISGWRVA